MKVVNIIASLDQGGAEMALLRLSKGMAESETEVVVVSLMQGGDLAPMYQRAGIRVIEISDTKRGNRWLGVARNLWRLGLAVRREKPSVIHTWMYTSNLLGGVASRILIPSVPVVWGIHHSLLDPKTTARKSRIVNWISARLSSILPSRIVYIGEESQGHHERQGYSRRKGQVIPNGVDMQVFRPDDSARSYLSETFGIDTSAPLIGYVGRYHPDKDIPNLVQAIHAWLSGGDPGHFLLCGSGLDSENSDLMALINEWGVHDRITLLGKQPFIDRIMPAFDIFTLTSSSEGLPTVLMEAMACGVPCVATDVGESSSIIGPAGVCVPPKDPNALAAGWRRLLTMNAEERAILRRDCVARIERNYSLRSSVESHQELYNQLVN